MNSAPTDSQPQTFILGGRPHIETPRLILRPYTSELDAIKDVEELHKNEDQLSDQSVHDLVTTMSRGIYVWPGSETSMLRLELAMLVKESGKLVGLVTLTEHISGFIELGYVVSPRFRGQGFTPEAAQALIEEIERRTGQRYFFAVTSTHNISSQRVAEKLGFDHVVEGDNGKLFLWKLPSNPLPP